MVENLYPTATAELAARRTQLAAEINDAFENSSRKVFADGALPEKTMQLIAVAVAHVTQCPYCITGHTSSPTGKGHGPRRSWRRSGSPPRCGPGARTPIQHWPCTHWVMEQVTNSAPARSTKHTLRLIHDLGK
jgi:AhpD family alkylhydroperoxidase